ncbi:MAG: AcvB/VirJ family lysyl-phosphatidylglycerol hydrolase [Vicinamibacteria bacterium]
MSACALLALLLLAAPAPADGPARAAPPASARAAAPAAEAFAFGEFGQVRVYAPAGPPSQVVLFVSGDGGWNLGVVDMAARLRAAGALVAGIDIRAYLRGLAARPGCAYPAGDLEELSRAVQLRAKLPEYHRPILVGYSSGATLVYAALAAGPPETFAGALSLGFCPDLEIAPLCAGRGLGARRRAKGPGYDLAPMASLGVPWMVLQGEVDQVCDPAGTRAYVAGIASARLFSLPRVGHGFGVPRNWEAQFLEAFRALLPAPPRPPGDAAVSDLPLTEVESAAPGEWFAVLLTGDGGFAQLDRTLAERFAARGVPTVGWSSLRYFWTPRAPEAAALDLERVLLHYAAAWRRPKALVVGYSFGADVLPFLLNRLSPRARALVGGTALVGLSDDASFEFHVSDWLGGGGGPEHATAPEVRRLPAPPLCVVGDEEHDSPCRTLGAAVRLVTRPGGHHFANDFVGLADAVLAGAGVSLVR